MRRQAFPNKKIKIGWKGDNIDILVYKPRWEQNKISVYLVWQLCIGAMYYKETWIFKILCIRDESVILCTHWYRFCVWENSNPTYLFVIES
jgi:hypothetical protein